MRKSLRLLLGTIALGAMITATAFAHNLGWDGGADPVPVCPPGGCAVN
jgi:hypothetical protein